MYKRSVLAAKLQDQHTAYLMNSSQAQAMLRQTCDGDSTCLKDHDQDECARDSDDTRADVSANATGRRAGQGANVRHARGRSGEHGQRLRVAHAARRMING